MVQHLPTEILLAILEVTDRDDLACLCRVSRLLNTQATSVLYKNTVLDIRMSAKFPYATGYTESWLAQLHGLALNTHNQCRNITSLTIENSHPHNTMLLRKTPPRGSRVPNKGEYLSHMERAPSLALVCSMLEVALQHMDSIREFTWAVDISPTSSLLAALSRKHLRSLTFYYCDGIYQTMTNNWPLEPDLTVFESNPLTSLSVMNLASDKAEHDLAHLITTSRRTLRSLKISFDSGGWHPRFSLEDQDSSSSDTDPYQYPEQLHRILRGVVQSGDALHLHTLEIHRISSINVRRWLKSFDFHTIKKFALIDTRFSSWQEETAELWRSLKDLGASFRYLVTDSQNEELAEFVRSFNGLEGLLLCNCDARGSPSPSNWLPPLSGHFSSLRYLFIPRNCHGSHFCHSTTVQAIIDMCPNLEEFGWGMRGRDMDAIFHALSNAPALRSIYVVNCQARTDRGGDDICDYPPVEFLEYFVTYYRQNPSPFYENLEKLSYSRILWEFVSTQLDSEEEEEMEYELEQEDLSDDEVRELTHDESMEGVVQTSNEPDTSDQVDLGNPMFIANPDVFSWERGLSGLTKIPVRAKWSSYANSTMANAVRFYVMQDTWGNPFDLDDPVLDECICGDPDFGTKPCRNCQIGPEREEIQPHCPVLFRD